MHQAAGSHGYTGLTRLSGLKALILPFMTMLEYAPPPIWLNAHIQDPRINVGDYTYFDQHISLAIFTPDDRIEIGKFCSLAKDIIIFAGGNHIMTRVTTFPFKWLSAEAVPEERYTDAASKGATIIGHDVWIGYGATILSGVKIGNGAVVGAQAVIASDVPAYAIVVGNPAKIIRYRFKPETVERLLELSWWDWESAKIAANLDLLYTNPDEWLPEIQWKEPQGDVLKFIGMPPAELDRPKKD
ncbi:MAG: CatB-related O-acetyltransferase [Nostoc sp.]|uniref:CatB-related O-acetyltransferase n=1 Tax=Nostoc sp. TaxID=1180 RepID=UPI002FFBBBC9